MDLMNRRRFMTACLGAGSAFGLAYATGLMPSKTGAYAQPVAAGGEVVNGLQLFEKKTFAMGSEVSIKVLCPDVNAGERAIEAAFDELRLIDRLMSLYRDDSQLVKLNRDKVVVEPHPYLVEVLNYARFVSDRTDGAFDITVQPLWEVYARAKAKGGYGVPETGDIEKAAADVDYHRVVVERDMVSLAGEGTAVTLNGIAQGFAADRLIGTLKTNGIEHALVNTGEIGAIGRKADATQWMAGVQHPREDGYLQVASLDNRCLATSGDYATTFTSDYQHHHIFDPKKGVSPSELASVCVAARSAMAADAMSTAIFVSGAKKGLALLKSLDGVDGLLVTKDMQRYETEGFSAAG